MRPPGARTAPLLLLSLHCLSLCAHPGCAARAGTARRADAVRAREGRGPDGVGSGGGPRPEYPRWKQCDVRWGKDAMGVPDSGTRATLCEQGCAVTSLAMGLAHVGAFGLGDADPGKLNAWLRAHGGYTCAGGDCANLVLNAPDHLTAGAVRLVGEWGGKCCGGAAAKPSEEAIKEGLAAAAAVAASRPARLDLAAKEPDASPEALIVLAHVRNGTHYVLLTGWDDSQGTFTAHDPAMFNQTQVKYDEFSDAIVYAVAPTAPPRPYPLFKQFDYRWAGDMIDTKTVGAVGCLLSSISMALAGHGISVPNAADGARMDPGVLNAWLKGHGGYVKNNLVESKVPAIDPSHVRWPPNGAHRAADLSPPEVEAMLAAGRPVIANVDDGGHFVLVTALWWRDGSADPPRLVVNDPGFWRSSYAFADAVGWRLFEMRDA